MLITHLAIVSSLPFFKNIFENHRKKTFLFLALPRVLAVFKAYSEAGCYFFMP